MILHDMHTDIIEQGKLIAIIMYVLESSTFSQFVTHHDRAKVNDIVAPNNVLPRKTIGPTENIFCPTIWPMVQQLMNKN